MVVSFPDGSSREYPEGTTALDIARSISQGLARKALVCRFAGGLMDLAAPLPGDGALEILTFDDPEGRDAMRHSASHLLASAVQKLYPGTRLGIGPAIEDGFYYDMDIPGFPGGEALEAVEAEMRRQAAADLPFVRREIGVEEARRIFSERGETCKLELVEELAARGEPLSVYQHGDFLDLCRGPHVPSTGRIRHFRLLSVAGAYWRGDEKNAMLTRIYGTVFDSPAALAEHLRLLEEARRRDHRRLGQELGLFTTGGDGGPGLIYWLPDGAIVREELERLWKDAHRSQGYRLVVTPHIAPSGLWKTSGHYDYYRDNMYFLPVDDGEYVLKPMNCPGHIIVFRSAKRSYRDLPLRLAELGTVYRHEKSGVLHGLMRVRGFTVDDGHIFCTPDQIIDEVKSVVRFALYFLGIFDFGYSIELSLCDPGNMCHYAGDASQWCLAEPALARALDEMGEEYRTVKGEAAFYGPKIDIKLRDAIGRFWQGPTIQFDFNIPARFDLTYTGPDGGEHRVFMVHRALFGSLERFIGNLVEHYAGNFPGWLAPLQVIILPITSAQHEKALETASGFRAAGLRCSVDRRSETVAFRIREAENRKVPFMLVIGDREAASGAVSLRRHGEGDQGSMPVGQALDLILSACRRPDLPDGGEFQSAEIR
ncbi:threonine--tRNA ligase [Candidatus Fermentibacteria bacterium]|nr:threonine--tRNA ligase [Candidatus Fermentibacteria bacterium]